MEKIVTFTDLKAWKEGHALVLLIYETTTDFPEAEKFGLIGQMRRCVLSVTSNLAEGFSRQSYREKVQFYSIALGSLTELQNQLHVVKDISLILTEQYEEISKQSVVVHKLINGLIRSSKSIIRNS